LPSKKVAKAEGGWRHSRRLDCSGPVGGDSLDENSGRQDASRDAATEEARLLLIVSLFPMAFAGFKLLAAQNAHTR
jgi:hypothetical protein